jgi:hypothetical protein
MICVLSMRRNSPAAWLASHKRERAARPVSSRLTKEHAPQRSDVRKGSMARLRGAPAWQIVRGCANSIVGTLRIVKFWLLLFARAYFAFTPNA